MILYLSVALCEERSQPPQIQKNYIFPTESLGKSKFLHYEVNLGVEDSNLSQGSLLGATKCYIVAWNYNTNRNNT